MKSSIYYFSTTLRTLLSRPNNNNYCRRKCYCYSTTSTSSSSTRANEDPAPHTSPLRGELRSWVIHSYLQKDDKPSLITSPRLPVLKDPTDVLIRVHSTSVNPIDVAMARGYGASTINVMRRLGGLDPLEPVGTILSDPFGKRLIEFPLTLGRDFAGTVEKVGLGVGGRVKVGDEVYGVVGVQRQGAHANYVVASVDTIRRKPGNLTFSQAASIPYVALTSWSALKVTGGYSTSCDKQRSLAGRRFLILGGSGGIGTFTIQYLRAEGAEVVTTCSGDAEALMASLGADKVIDYKGEDYGERIKEFGPYDCILDAAGPSKPQKEMDFLLSNLKPVKGQYITLSSPFLRNIDSFGLLGGAAKNLGDLISSNVNSIRKGKTGGGGLVKWAFFIPKGDELEKVAKLLERQKIRPVIHKTFTFDEVPDAYRSMEEGHSRGKIVIDVK